MSVKCHLSLKVMGCVLTSTGWWAWAIHNFILAFIQQHSAGPYGTIGICHTILLSPSK